MTLDVENDGSRHTLTLTRDSENVSLGVSGLHQVLSYRIYKTSPDTPPYKEAETERDYYREFVALHTDHPVLRFVETLPTPMFLGLDRRATLAEGVTYRSPTRYLRPTVRNVFGAPLGRSLAEASGLAENKYRDVLILNGREEAQLRRQLLLNLLTLEPTTDDGSISIPTRADIQELRNVRRLVNDLPKILGLPPEEVNKRMLPLLNVLTKASEKIPDGIEPSVLFGQSGVESTAFQAVMEWNVNSPQLKTIRIVSDLVSAYNKKSEQIRETTNRYLRLLNEFISDSGKEVRFDEKGYIHFSLEQSSDNWPIESLSSGEAQIFVIITHLLFNPLAQRANVFIIDEPELSLHVQWQEIFVQSVISANSNIQYVMATHSPSIILDRLDRCIDLNSNAATRKLVAARQRRRRRIVGSI
jgi:hypothetical protein